MELIGTKIANGRYLISNHHFNIKNNAKLKIDNEEFSLKDLSITTISNPADMVEVDGDTFIGIFGFDKVSDVETNAMYCKPFNSKGVSDGI